MKNLFSLVALAGMFMLMSFSFQAEKETLNNKSDSYYLMILDGGGPSTVADITCADVADMLCGHTNYECWFGIMGKCRQL